MDALDPDEFIAIIGSLRAQETAHFCCEHKQKECDKYPLLDPDFYERSRITPKNPEEFHWTIQWSRLFAAQRYLQKVNLGHQLNREIISSLAINS
jgi:hypothetical protein